MEIRIELGEVFHEEILELVHAVVVARVALAAGCEDVRVPLVAVDVEEEIDARVEHLLPNGEDLGAHLRGGLHPLPIEVRAGRVVSEPVPRTQDLGRHGCRGRLAVRRRYDGRPGREPRGEAIDGAAVELREELAGDRRAAAGSEPPRERCDAARSGDLE